MKVARWLLPLVSLLLVVGFTWWDTTRSGAGPGPLHPAHAAVVASGSCEQCHSEGALSVDGCVVCHPAIGAQRDRGVGLHGRQPAAELARCGSCHPEHHGAQVPPIAPHAFARAGVPDPARYDHAHVVFSLSGAHVELACTRCHEHAEAEMPPAGGRFLGLSQACTACHRDVHVGAFGAGCEQCHGQEQPFAAAPGFAHGRFRLEGAHAQVACAACHEPGSQNDVAREQQEPAPVRACAACHASPHGDASTPPSALRLDAAADCARCHDARGWSAARPSPEAHAALGFVLAGAHATTSCASCHGDPATPQRWTGATPAADSCARCHESPHAAALVASATAASGPADGCAGCHGAGDADFARGKVTAPQHAAIGFSLAAPHADVACASCHVGASRAERYPGREAAACQVCHDDVHQGQFGASPRCASCHAATRFQPSTFGVVAHATTAFPLTGAHDAVACASCHGSENGARRFRGTQQSCAACHRDVHDGRFDRPGLPRSVDGRDGCARCHTTSAFAQVSGSFDHALWTGYELSLAHADVACAACHRVPDGTSLGAVPGPGCADCHRDPHLGQFAADGRTDCARCHDAGSFRPAHVDHQQTRFPLDDVHQSVDCARCHQSYSVGAERVVRYRPLGTKCGDCHRVGGGEVRR